MFTREVLEKYETSRIGKKIHVLYDIIKHRIFTQVKIFSFSIALRNVTPFILVLLGIGVCWIPSERGKSNGYFVRDLVKVVWGVCGRFVFSRWIIRGLFILAYWCIGISVQARENRAEPEWQWLYLLQKRERKEANRWVVPIECMSKEADSIRFFII